MHDNPALDPRPIRVMSSANRSIEGGAGGAASAFI